MARSLRIAPGRTSPRCLVIGTALSENASKTEPAKLLAVFVVDTDEKELSTPLDKVRQLLREMSSGDHRAASADSMRHAVSRWLPRYRSGGVFLR